MARYIDADASVGIGYLSDWYQNSIDDTKPPIWTDEHLEELTNDFIVIPKDTPTADVVEVVRCKECKHKTHSNKRIMCKKDAIKTAMGFYYGLIATEPNNFCSCGERRTE